MIKFQRFFIISLLCLFTYQAYAEAPVVDESENFAIFDEQAGIDQPLAKSSEDITIDNEIPLAQDTADGPSNVALLDKLQAMKQEIQELRGQLEVQAHDLKLLQQQLAYYKDIELRDNNKLSQPYAPKTASARPSVPVNKTTIDQLSAKEKPAIKQSSASGRTNPVDEQISYLAAYDMVKNKRFDEALIAMQQFVKQHPQGGYTANAEYWLGELYLVKNNYPKAIEHFELVLQQFPSSSKAAPSNLKIGYALAALGKKNDARLRLQQVLKNYPDTPTAQLAATKLESLGLS